MTLASINHLNILLMLLALAAAFAVPYEAFLFAYAFIGPAHYLTEISWLHDRKYFTRRKSDPIVLLLLSAFAVLGSASILGRYRVSALSGVGMELTFAAFGAALIFTAVKPWPQRFFAGSILIAFILATRKTGPAQSIFGVYLPTLIHVYVFTGAFILLGALKSRERSGYLSLAAFAACPILCFVLLPSSSWYRPTEWGAANYAAAIGDLNLAFNINVMRNNPLDMRYALSHINAEFVEPARRNPAFLLALGPLDPSFFDSRVVSPAHLPSVAADPFRLLYLDPSYLRVGRFIAFAYAYHYLNWFSKTSVIRWHEVPKSRFIAVGVAWLASVALFLADYQAGLRWLFFLGFAHILLEFPLNHQCMIGIAREVSSRFRRAPNPAGAARKKMP